MKSTCHNRKARAAAAGILVCLTAQGVFAQGEPTLVGVDEATMSRLDQTVPVVGQMVAKRRGTVASRISGPVEDVIVQIGERVVENQPLARIDTEILQLRRTLAHAALKEEQANLITSTAERELAQQEVDRLSRLKDSASTSRADYDDAVQSLIIAEARVGVAEVKVASAQASLRLSETNLRYATVRAPYAGVITQRLAEAGEFVQTGQPLVHMVAYKDLEIEADVPFDRIAGLTPGTEVAFELDSDHVYSAAVRALVPEENTRSRTRVARFEIGDSVLAQGVAIGQSVTLRIPISAPRDVVTIHKDALIHQGEQVIVFLVVDGKAQPRPITVGQAVGQRLEVVNGIAPGDVVIVRGNERIRPGQDVMVSAPQAS